MSRRFDYFVIFAGMRTGSNYLEQNIGSVPDIKCYGELFNPYFIAHEGQEEFQGITLGAREADPNSLISHIQAETPAMPGFRLFHDHDPRVRRLAIQDPRCGKIILTRNPLESYVSYKSALSTNQWVLTDAKGQVDTPLVDFDVEEFRVFAEAQAVFLRDLRKQLLAVGQTALQLDYADLIEVDSLNGVLGFLGSEHRLTRPERTLKRQNAEDLVRRVANVEDMKSSVSQLDPFDLDPTVSARLERGAAVRSFIAGKASSLLYLPVHSPFSQAIEAWLTDRDEGARPKSNMTQKDLRSWRETHPEARSFTVLCHPVRRAWDAFEAAILPTDLQAFSEVRHGLVTAYKVPLPKKWPDPDLPKGQLRRAFIAFCKVLKANLAGQTSLRIDELWVGQHTRLHGMSAIALPDLILREGEETSALKGLCETFGSVPAQLVLPSASPHLSLIYDEKVEAVVRAAYARDYAAFGFADWPWP